MDNRKLCIVLKSNSILDKASIRAAKAKNYEIFKFDRMVKIIKEKNITKKIKLYKEYLKKIDIDEFSSVMMIYTPIDKDKLGKKIDNELNEHFLDPLAIALSFSQIININADNRILFIGDAKGYDFVNTVSINEDIKNNLLIEFALKTQVAGNVKTLSSYLALNLAKFNIKINSAFFGPFSKKDSPDVIRQYNAKSLVRFPLTVSDISESLEIFLDEKNDYMTGQLLKFDGGISIW